MELHFSDEAIEGAKEEIRKELYREKEQTDPIVDGIRRHPINRKPTPLKTDPSWKLRR